MARTHQSLVVAGLLAGVLASVHSAQAVVIPVNNPGFDYTMNGDGTGLNQTVGVPAVVDSYTELSTGGTSYQVVTFGGGSFAPNGTATVPNWVITENGNDGGVQYLGAGYWFTDPGSPVGMTAGPATLSQTLAGALAAHTEYTLTVELFGRTQANIQITDPNLATVQLQDIGGAALAGATNVAQLGDAHWLVTHTATSGNIAAGDLVLVLSGAGEGNVQYNYDNVTLNAEAIPEPASLALLGLGGVALLRRRRSHA